MASNSSKYFQISLVDSEQLKKKWTWLLVDDLAPQNLDSFWLQNCLASPQKSRLIWCLIFRIADCRPISSLPISSLVRRIEPCIGHMNWFRSGIEWIENSIFEFTYWQVEALKAEQKVIQVYMDHRPWWIEHKICLKMKN